MEQQKETTIETLKAKIASLESELADKRKGIDRPKAKWFANVRPMLKPIYSMEWASEWLIYYVKKWQWVEVVDFFVLFSGVGSYVWDKFITHSQEKLLAYQTISTTIKTPGFISLKKNL
ncbi:MAG: hypothetical protein ACI9FJ_000945 [Alteromonadaceae bacterium]|jgi:hypothetical protein